MTGGVTPVYAAPETFDGWVSRFSDQYSLAVTYYHLRTGKMLFKGDQLRAQHIDAAPRIVGGE